MIRSAHPDATTFEPADFAGSIDEIRILLQAVARGLRGLDLLARLGVEIHHSLRRVDWSIADPMYGRPYVEDHGVRLEHHRWLRIADRYVLWLGIVEVEDCDLNILIHRGAFGDSPSTIDGLVRIPRLEMKFRRMHGLDTERFTT